MQNPQKIVIFAENLESMLSQQVREYIPKIKQYLATQPVVRAWIFGSCSRGEETPSSDLDLLVVYDDSKTLVNLFAISSMAQSIKKLVGRNVDLVEEGDLLSFAVPSVEKDRILIYER